MAATTDQKARFLDLITGVLELVRDGNRDIADVSAMLQVIKDDANFATRLLAKDGSPAPVPKPVIPNYPADGEVFELTLDGDVPENNPIHGMVAGDGYDPKGWQYNGTRVAGKQTRRFKLVSVGYCRNLDEVRQKLAQHGTVPEGQWRVAFKAAYPKPDGRGPVGVADPSWVNPIGFAFFPFVNSVGLSDFRWAGFGFYEYWRWLVAARRASSGN